MGNTVLDGVRVVSLSTMGAAPSAAEILRVWGAEVIKVEAITGDPCRLAGASYGYDTVDEYTAFRNFNGGKKSLALNLKSPEGMEIMHKLLATADVFMSNNRYKALTKFGLDYETLHPKYPRLVFGHLSGYGIEGPDKDTPGFDTASFWARSGMLIDWVDANCEPRVPISPPNGVGDFLTGSSLAGGIAAALYKQKMTGIGEKVITSLLANAVWGAQCEIQSTTEGSWRYPFTRQKPASPYTNTFQTKDGEWMFITAFAQYEKKWPLLCKAIGREDLVDDERYSTPKNAVAHTKEYTEFMEEAIGKMTLDELDKALTDVDIAHARIRHFKDLIHDEQVRANNFIFEYEWPSGNKSLLEAPPVQFGNVEAPQVGHFPQIGEHTEEILNSLGYEEYEIRELEAKNIIRTYKK